MWWRGVLAVLLIVRAFADLFYFGMLATLYGDVAMLIIGFILLMYKNIFS